MQRKQGQSGYIKIALLIIKVICVMMPFIAFSIYCSQYMLSYVDGETPYYLWNKDFVCSEHEKKYNVVILGDSAANAAYVPELLSDATINLSLGGMTAMENYYILEDWLNYNEPPQDVFISFGDSHMYMNECFWNRTMYSHRFNLQQNIEMVRNAVEYNDESIVVDGYMGDFVEYELYLPSKYVTSVMNASFNQRYLENKASLDNIELHSGWYIGRNVREYVGTESITLREYKVAPLYDFYIKKIIELCAEKEIAVHIVRLPQPENICFDEEYRIQIYDYYEQLEESYENVSFDWYSESYEKSRFVDTVHMNIRGSKAFCSFLKKEWSDCFDDKYSEQQLKAIGDTIKWESDLSELFRYTENGSYTILMFDGTKQLETLYGEEVAQITSSEGTFNQLYIVGYNEMSEMEHIDIFTEETMLKVGIGGEKAVDWCLVDQGELAVAVIDNHRNIIVDKKQYKYVDSGFSIVLQQKVSEK